MKKILLIAISVCFLLIGCSENNTDSDIEVLKASDGSTIFRSESGDSYTCKSIPFRMTYDGIGITYNSVNFYQDSTENGYNIYAVITIDTSEVSEKNLYWIEEDEAIEPTVYLTNKKNKLDFDSMGFLCKYVDGKKIHYAFRMPSEYRYSFEETEIYASIDLQQSETYQYKDDDGEISELNKCNSYGFEYTIEHASELSTTDSIDHELYMAMVDGLKNIKNTYEDMLDN